MLIIDKGQCSGQTLLFMLIRLIHAALGSFKPRALAHSSTLAVLITQPSPPDKWLLKTPLNCSLRILRSGLVSPRSTQQRSLYFSKVSPSFLMALRSVIATNVSVSPADLVSVLGASAGFVLAALSFLDFASGFAGAAGAVAGFDAVFALGVSSLKRASYASLI